MSIEQAWIAFHGRMAALGALITTEGYPEDPRQRAEGYRNLVRVQRYALDWFLESHDAARPRFMRFGDELTRWGAPNADNNYLRAHIEASGTYRISGNLAGVREILISLHDGDMSQGRTAVFHEVSLEDLAVDQDGAFELHLGGEARAGNWMPLDAEIDHVLVRQYVADWLTDPVAALDIERLDPVAPVAPLSPEVVIDALDRSATWVEKSVPYWREYYDALRVFTQANEMMAPRRPEAAALNMLLGGSRFELAADQAMIIEFEVPEASYWSFQISSPTWMESLDFAGHLTSLNDRQVHLDVDGRCRMVVAGQDPGVQNWLDTTGLPEGLMAYRFVKAAQAPHPTATVLALDEVGAHLPTTTPAFSAADRGAQLAARRAGVARRLRR